MSLAYNKYNVFVADLANKVQNLGSDTLEIALTDTLPLATDSVISGEISYSNIVNGGTTGRNITITSSAQSGGTYKLVGNALTLTANGTVPQWRYIVLRNKTATKLISWFDYGSEVNMTSGDTLTVTPDAVNGLLQLA